MIRELNYLEIYKYEKWNSNVIPVMNEGQIMDGLLNVKQGTTTPPELLSESELIQKMDTYGIGTDATIHEHIKTI